MKTLKLAKNLTLPLDLVTQTVAVLAKRRAGKSYTMRRLAEQLLTAGQQVVLVDPKGDQWGIRSAADGRSPGLPVVILGGERADVPLEVGAGEIVAKLVVEERVSALLDLSLLRKHEVATFMTAFLETLYRLKAREVYRTPLMLVIDEADAIAPQKPPKGHERMLGAAEDIVRRGGQRGIGCVLVTQRSAVLNKNVLTQAQVLIVLRTIAPQDLAALDAWIDVHGTPDQRQTLMTSLPALPVGDAWVWSPGWPTADGIFARVHVLPIETYDSGRSPEPGEKRVEPKHLADVDLEALRRQMAATIEKAKADDPRELRKALTDKDRRIRELEQAASGFPNSDEKARPAASTPPLLTDADRTLLASLAAALRDRTAKAAEVLHAADSRADRLVQTAIAEYLHTIRNVNLEVGADVAKTLERVGLRKILAKLEGLTLTAMPGPGRPTALAPPARVTRPPRSPGAPAADREARAPTSESSLPPARQKILNALAFLRGVGVVPADKTQLALFVGVSPTSGGYFNNLGALRSDGFIAYPSGGTVDLTDAGAALARVDGIPTTTGELHDAVRAKLPPAKWKVLEAVIEAYPDPVPKDDLATRIDVSPTSGGYFNNLGSLRTLGLIDYPRPGYVVATPVLFLER